MLGTLGCGSGSGTRAEAVSATDPTGSTSGQLTSLAVGKTARLSMSPLQDALNAGVDWAVTCGGSPLNGSRTGGACGTLSPAHTPDGAATLYTAPAQVPIGGNVTITAAVTSDPSASSDVTLTITPASIVLSFTPAPIASLNAGASEDFTVHILNDLTGAGANWTATCSSAAGLCGTFSPTATVSDGQTIYTAPAAVPVGGTVTVTATSAADPTRSVSASVAVLPAPQPIAVTLSQAAFTVGERSTVAFLGTVANDASNAGLTWTVTCPSTTGNCGNITPATGPSGGVAVYKAPFTATGVNPVLVTATATATNGAQTPATSTATGMVTAASTIGVLVTAVPASVLPLGTTGLTANVANDATDAGVTWNVACAANTAGACGAISNQMSSAGTYTATYTAPSAIPGSGGVIVSATPNAASNAAASAMVPDNPGLAAITIVSAPPSVAFITPPPVTLAAGAQATVSAGVTNDVVSGGVTWSVQCGSTASGGCGYIQPYQTASAVNALYVAPPVPPTGTTGTLGAGQISIVATSTADPSVSVVSPAPVTITASTARTIRFVPFAPSQVQAGTTTNLQAAVGNDSSNAGVDWQVCSSGCGYFTTAPAIAAIPATATTPFVPAVPAVTSTMVKGWPNNLPIPYAAPPTVPSGGTAAITAAAHVDGNTSLAASVVITSETTGPALSGHVFAGRQPVQGAAVSLYVAGTAGYGSAASLIYSPLSTPNVTTGKDGGFTVAGGYSCPQPNSQAYLIAEGGTFGTSAFNASLTLMTALGPCSGLSGTPVVLNEVTTIASAWSLSSFAANDELTGASSYLYLGSDSANAVGLANAFASVSNMVDITTGQALFTVPAGNAGVPYAEINTLANLLNTCTASSGGAEDDGSPCGTLFSAADTLGTNVQFNSTPPSDTVQAAFNIAQHPSPGGFLDYEFPGGGGVLNVENLVALTTPGSPFQPILNAPPHDFSISLNYTGGGGLSASSSANSMALDGSGNIWITDTAANAAIEWNNTGTPITSAGFTAASLSAPGPMAIDASSNVWICDSNGLTELNSLGTEAQGSPFIGGGVSSACQGLAFDGLGNLWVNNQNSVSKFTSLGVPLSPSTGYTIATSPTDATILPLLPPIAIDDSNNVWVGVLGLGGSQVDLDFAELNNGSGVPNYLNGPPTGTAPLSNYVIVEADATQTQIAINAAGAVWVPINGSNQQLTEILPYEGPGTTDRTTPGFTTNGVSSPLNDARGVAIDGANLVWAASTAYTFGGATLPGGLAEISPSSSQLGNFAYFASPTLANRALAVAVDSAGNVWALLDNNTVTEYVGLATPAVTPLALAVKNKKLGAEP